MENMYDTPDGMQPFIPNDRATKFKRWFKEAVDASRDWRDIAYEDQDFYNGIQWSSEELSSMSKLKKPPITINRIAPMINLVSGWQRLNRYDIDFLPRTGDDTQKAKLRKAITKYVMDESNYDDEESAMFTNSEITGLGWLEVGYKFDPELGDGEAFIRSVSEFDMYVDPESHDRYFRDAKYVIRARWVDKEELKSDYPEYADEIDAQHRQYLSEEDENHREHDRYWYQRELNKIRLAECWYKTSRRKKAYLLTDGTVIYEPPDEVTALLVVREIEYTKTEVRMIAFFDGVVLEDIDSPYKHGEIPFVAMPWSMHNSIPHGVVFSLKDLQREYNKRRSQQMHILNTSANSGWMIEDGAMSQQELSALKESGSQPGVVIKVASGTLTTNRIRRLEPQASPAAVENAAIETSREFMSASGINESLLGTDVSNLASGRAIELKQKQAITHLAVPFDALRFVKKRVAYMLWGSRGKPGIIPQFYTEEKTFRITADNANGYDFVSVNQKQQIQDPATGQIITQTLNDLSIGDFDIVVSDSPMSATARMGEFWKLVEALSQIGLTGDKSEIALDMLIDLLNIPQKDEIKKRLQQRQAQAQQQQQQQMQMQMEIEQQKHLAKNIAYKDLQLPMQLQLAAKAGIFPQEYADAFMQWSVNQYANSLGIGGQQTMPQQVPNQPPMPPMPTNGQGVPLNANGRPMFYK